MSKFSRITAASAVLASVTVTGITTTGVASAATGRGLPDLSISASRSDCTVTVTNKGPVTAVKSVVFAAVFGGVTSPGEDIAPGATRTIHYLDCAGLPLLTYTYDSNGDSNPFNNVAIG